MATLKIITSYKKDNSFKQFIGLQSDDQSDKDINLSDYLDPDKTLVLYHDGPDKIPGEGDTIYEKDQDGNFIKIKNRAFKTHEENDLTVAVNIVTNNKGEVNIK